MQLSQGICWHRRLTGGEAPLRTGIIAAGAIGVAALIPWILEQLHKPDEWFTQEVIAKGNHIQIFVNRKKTVDFVDTNNSFTKGHFAIQQHSSFKDKTTGDDIESVIYVRKAEVKELPSK